MYWEDNAALANSTLVYNTGRSVGAVMGLLDEKQGKLAMPDVLITAVGTKVRLPLPPVLLMAKESGGTAGGGGGARPRVHSWCGVHADVQVWLLDEVRSNATGKKWREDEVWAARLDEGWDLEKAR